MRKPLTSMKEFTKQHTKVDKNLKAYATTKRGRQLSQDAISSLKHSSALSLKATNATARIVVAATANWKLRQFLEANAANQIFWVTITPDMLGLPLHKAERFRPDICRGEVAKIFEGFDYFGMIDIAYYPRRKNGRLGSKNLRYHLPGPLASFHIHLLAWGAEENEIIQLRASFNASCRSLSPNREPFFYTVVSTKEALEKNYYQLKAPVSAYSASTYLREHVDPDTGEILFRPDKNWTTGKRAIKQGEAAQIHNAITHLTIDQLMLGGGQGLILKREIVSRAKGRLAMHEAGMHFLAKYKLEQLYRRAHNAGNEPQQNPKQLTKKDFYEK